jgi:high-affinity Fe2+/Pb2+ permease
MNDVLRPWIARVAAVLVSGLAGWLFTRYQVETPDDVRGILTTTVEVVIVMLFTYVLTHIPISKKARRSSASGRRTRPLKSASSKRASRTGISRNPHRFHP